MFMDYLKKVTDFIMPLEPMPEEEEEEVTKAEPVKVQEKKADVVENTMPAKKVASGGGGSEFNIPVGVMSSSESGTVSYGGMKFSAEAAPQTSRPQLSVVQNKGAAISVKIFAPTNFDHVSVIATAILSKNAAIVNYDYVNVNDQRRICDFLNGTCYVTDGMASRISDKIVLYCPNGIDATDMASAMSSMNSMRF